MMFLTSNPNLPITTDKTLEVMMRQESRAEEWARGYVCANLDIGRFEKQFGRFPTHEELKFMRDEVYPVAKESP